MVNNGGGLRRTGDTPQDMPRIWLSPRHSRRQMAIRLNELSKIALGHPQTLDIKVMPNTIIIKAGGAGGYKITKIDKYWEQACVASLYKIKDRLLFECSEGNWLPVEVCQKSLILNIKNKESNAAKQILTPHYPHEPIN